MFKIYLLDSRNYPAVLYDDLHIFEPAVLEPELEMNGDNGILIGKLTFKLHDPSIAPQLRLLQNTVIVTQMIGGVETVIFRGRPLLRDDDDYNDQDYTFEGILAGLNDTLQTPSIDKGIGFTSHLAIILNRHNYLASSYAYGNKNRMVDYSKIDRHFELSYMHTIEGDPFSESLAYKANIDPVALDYVRTRASTMDHLKTQFIDSWGGYFYLENEPLTYDSDGCVVLHNYLNYVDIYSPDQVHINAQRIEFGKNLISIRRSVSADDFATVLIPLGKQLTDIEKAWPYYQSVENNKVRKIVSSPDEAVLENYNSTNAYINSETAAVTTGGGSSYVILNDVEVEPGDVFYLTTYLEGFSTDVSAASYAILSRDATKVFSIGSSVRNSKDSGGTVTVKNLVLKDERIEIPTPEDTSVLLKLRMAYMISANDPNGGFVLKKFNPQYQEDNVTIMSVSPVATGTIRKRGQFDVGRDVFPDATEDAEAPETYEQSKRVYNNDLYEIFGSIEKTVEFSDYGIDNLSTIYSKAAMMLEKMGEDLEIEIQAADLSYIDETQEPFQPYDLVPVYSEPHGIDMMLPIVKMTLPLADPAAATYTLQNDIHLSEDSKKYISQMVSSPGASAQKNQTVVIYNGGGSGGGSGEQGPPGPAGADGYSPTVAVTTITGGHTVTITDTNGDHPFNVMDGQDGQDGQDGADGVSPTVTVTPITGGHRVTITDATQTNTFDVMDGDDSSGIGNAVTMTKTNGVWQLDSVGMWRTLWNHFSEEFLLVARDGNFVRNMYKVGLEYTNADSIDSVDIYFSDQRYNGRASEGNVFKLTVPETGNGTITVITGADIPTSGGGGSAVYEIPITATSYSWSTDKQGDEIYANADNCVLVVNGTTYLAVLSSEKYTENGSQYVRIVGVEYDVLNSNDYEFYAYEVVAENSDTGSPIVTRRHYDSDFFIRHHVFFYNENTNAITNTAGVAATGSDIDNILTAGFSSVYIIGELMENGDMTYYFYTPMTDESVGSNTGSVKFSRTTDTGVEILTIPANSSTATKTTSPFSDGSGNFVRIDYNGGTADVTHNGSAITGSQIKALLDRQDSGAIMVDTNGDPDAVYHLKNIYSDGRIEFEGEVGNSIVNVVVPANNSTGYLTAKAKLQVYYYLDGTTVKSAATNLAVTGQQIDNLTIDVGLAPIIYVNEFNSSTQYHYYSQDSAGLRFRTLDGTQEILVNYSSTTVTRSLVNPYIVYAVYDNENERYVLKKGTSQSSENVTYNDLSKHLRNVWLNNQLPIHECSPDDGYIEFLFIDTQIVSGVVTTVQWLVQAGNVSGVTVTRTEVSGSGGNSSNVFYYVDGTNIKSAVDNTVKTGRQIYNETIALGLSPIIYEAEGSPVYADMQYHYYRFDSAGIVLRRLDGKFDIRLAATSTTFVKIENGYNTPYRIKFSWDSSAQKYNVQGRSDSGNYYNIGYAALDYYAEGLWIDQGVPVSSIFRSDGYIYIVFNDFQITSNTATLVEWTIEASRTNGVTATRTVKKFQLTEYYTVTLNADGTVNTKDNNLSWSTVSARMSYPNCADYLLITWGSTLFTAKAVEKAANGGIKFIADVEHDGIQRHMVFTLTSSNALTTTAIETYSLQPVTVWEVTDVSQGLLALNTNISSNLAWQLTNLNLSPFKRIKIYSKAGRKTGALAADSSITPASIIEMSLDDRAKETVSQNMFIGSSVVQNPNDPNRLGILTCAVSADKTKFAVVRSTTLYGTAATSNTDAYPYVFKIEGCYD